MPSLNLTRLLLDVHLEGGRGDAVAIREPRLTWSYAKLAGEAGRRGVAFSSRGVGPGDRVALLMHDSAEFAACFLGALRIGALPVPVAKLMSATDVRALLVDARPKLVVAHRDLAPVLEEVCEELPEPPEVLEVELGGRPTGRNAELMAVIASQAPSCAPVDGDGPALLLYSGGTGGAPRGALHTAAGVRAAFDLWAVEVLGLGASDRVYSTAALSNSYGLATGLLFPLLAGATACLLPSRARPQSVFDVLPYFQPTVFVSTPSLWAQMLNDFRAETAPRPSHFRGVRAAVSGAELLPEKLWHRVKESFGISLLQGFGSTESLHFFLSFGREEMKPGASGRLVEGFEVRILDEQGQPVAAQEIGTLEVRGPSVAKGYFRRGTDAEVFREGGWLHTSDRFFADAEGWYYHCGRSDDLFRVSGKYVAPLEVENTLLAHPSVWECAVVGREDGDGMTIPVAYVVPNVGHAPSPELGRELMDFVKREIAPYKFPRRVEFVSELPRGSGGKVQRWRLGQKA